MSNRSLLTLWQQYALCITLGITISSSASNTSLLTYSQRRLMLSCYQQRYTQQQIPLLLHLYQGTKNILSNRYVQAGLAMAGAGALAYMIHHTARSYLQNTVQSYRLGSSHAVFNHVPQIREQRTLSTLTETELAHYRTHVVEQLYPPAITDVIVDHTRCLDVDHATTQEATLVAQRTNIKNILENCCRLPMDVGNMVVDYMADWHQSAVGLAPQWVTDPDRPHQRLRALAPIDSTRFAFATQEKHTFPCFKYVYNINQKSCHLIDRSSSYFSRRLHKNLIHFWKFGVVGGLGAEPRCGVVNSACPIHLKVMPGSQSRYHTVNFDTSYRMQDFLIDDDIIISLYSGTDELDFINPTTGHIQETIHLPNNTVNFVAIPAHRKVALIKRYRSSSKGIIILDINSHQFSTLTTMPGSDSKFVALSAFPDGRLIVATENDIAIWDITRKTTLATITRLTKSSKMLDRHLAALSNSKFIEAFPNGQINIYENYIYPT